MAEEPAPVLGYEPPRDRQRRPRRRDADDNLGIVSCIVGVTSISLYAVAFLLAWRYRPSDAVFMLAGFSVLACLGAGIPLALAGLAAPERRWLYPAMGLIVNILWPVALFVIFATSSRLVRIISAS